MADRPTKPGPVQSRSRAPAPGARVSAPGAAADEDDEELTRVAGAPPAASHPKNTVLPNQLHRSGEIEQRDQGQPSLPMGDWEEKTVVDDSQLTNPKAALSSLLHNGNPADEELTLDEPQRVQALSLGPSAPKQTVRAQPKPQSPPASQATSGKLVVTAGNDRGREFPLAGKPFSVGRGIDNDVVLTDIAVSRKHLSIEFDGTRYKIADAGSGNGTLINDQLETGSRVLQHGDQIEIGNTVFRFEHPPSAGGAPGGPAPAAAPGDPGMRNPAIPQPGPAPSAGSAPVAALGGAQPQRTQLPPPRRDGVNPVPGPAGAPVGELPAPQMSAPPPAAAPGALGPAVPGPSPGLPQVQQQAQQQPQRPFANPGMPGPAAAAMPGPAGSLVPVRSTSLAPSELPSPRKTAIGVALTLLVIGVLATLGLLLGDDEQLATRGAAQQEDGASALDGAADETMTAPAVEGEEPASKENAADDGDGAASKDEEGTKKKGQDERSSIEGLESDGPGDESAGLGWAPVWGTDESLLVARAGEALLGDSEVEPEVRPEARAEGEAAAGEDASAATAPEPGQTGQTDETGGQTGEVAATALAGDTTPAEPPRSPAQARAEAKKRYARSDFTGAAQVLREAAARAPRRRAASLRRLAAKHQAVGRHIQRASAVQARNPGLAMNEYGKALRMDRSLAGSHVPLLRQRLAQVAPSAAGAYMSEGNYVSARWSADVAARHGAGDHPQVARVRQGLEEAAQEMYREGAGLRRRNPKRAQQLLEKVMKIVPAKSPWHVKAKKMLSLRRKRR